MACSSVEGSSTLSEVRVVGLYQYIFLFSFPKKDDALNVPGATSTETGVSCELRADGVLRSWAAEACRQAHGGRVLESAPNHGYHPTNFRKNSNRSWFLRLLPMLRADDAQPDAHRRMPDDSDFRAGQRHTQRPDYDRADALGKQRRDLSREVLS